MADQGVMVEYNGGRNRTASSSMAITTVPPGTPSVDYRQYPPPLAAYEEVVASPGRFVETLQKFHASMRTKFRIPVIGGQRLDLHRLFVEVTSRGGIMKALQEKRWREVTGIFGFPLSATNAAFILRKHYYSLLFHYEQVYYFQAGGWSQNNTATSQSASRVTNLPHASAEPKLLALPPIRAARPEEQGERVAKSLPEGSAVRGVIDGKFDSGYLITVLIGSEKCKGILYQTPLSMAHQEQHQNIHQYHSTSINDNNSLPTAQRVVRRRRRKRSEMRKRDPARPKPNRSGYNFFYADHHARLKQLYRGKDKAVSWIVGDSWNKLSDAEKAVYREKAAKDKERYRMELQAYRERLKAGKTSYSSVPIQRHHDESYPNIMGMPNLHRPENSNSFQTLLNDVCLDKSANMNSQANTVLRTADSVPLHSQPLGTNLNVMESDDKLQTDEEEEEEEEDYSSIGDEYSSDRSEESELHLGKAQIIGDASAIQEKFYSSELDANVMGQQTNNHTGGVPITSHATPMQQQLIQPDVEMRDKQ